MFAQVVVHVAERVPEGFLAACVVSCHNGVQTTENMEFAMGVAGSQNSHQPGGSTMHALSHTSVPARFRDPGPP
jgi:hypothetical protein